MNYKEFNVNMTILKQQILYDELSDYSLCHFKIGNI